MIILGLLAVALICLIVGLALPSTAWLIASLIASIGAGYVLFRARTLIAGAHAGEPGAHAMDAGATTAVLEREPVEAAPAEAPRRTRAQTRAEARAEARAAKAAAAAEAEAEAPVVPADETAGDAEVAAGAAHSDPTTEVSGAEFLAGVSSEEPTVADVPATEEHEVPSQELLPPPVEDVPAPVEANDGDVWVIDGRPRYHLASCAIIQGQDAEPIPYEQATEDGFMPCSLCEPNIVRATTA